MVCAVIRSLVLEVNGLLNLDKKAFSRVGTVHSIRGGTKRGSMELAGGPLTSVFRESAR